MTGPKPSDEEIAEKFWNDFSHGFDMAEELSRTVEVMCRYDRYAGCFIPLLIEDK